MQPILYGNPASGHSWKVRQALALLGVAHRYVVVDILRPREEREPAFVDASPYGEVPVLVRDDGVHAQSNAILLLLARESGRLGGPGVGTLERWLFWEANRIGFSLANLRWETAFEAARNEPVIAMLRSRADADAAVLDRLLSEREFVAGDSLSMADVACAAYLQFADEAGFDLGPLPNVRAWLGTLAATPGWSHARDLMSDPSTPAG